MRQQRTTYPRRPDISVTILVIGGMAYFLLCVPAIGRRGYPPIDPLWLAMPHLWLAPLCLSSLFDSGIYVSRRWHLLLYALSTAFIHAATMGLIVPRHVTFIGTLLMTVFFVGPIHVVVTLVVESMLQALLRFGRVLEPASSRTQLLPQIPLIAWLVGCLTVGVTFGFPFAFRNYIVQAEKARGKQCADADWAAGEAVLLRHNFPNEIHRGGCVIAFNCDEDTGLPLRPQTADNGFAQAYNQRIHELLLHEGTPSWSMKPHIVDAVELVRLLDSNEFDEITELPFDVTPDITVFRNATISRWGSTMSSFSNSMSIATPSLLTAGGSEGERIYYKFPEANADVVFIRSGKTWVGAFHRSGQMIAFATR